MFYQKNEKTDRGIFYFCECPKCNKEAEFNLTETLEQNKFLFFTTSKNLYYHMICHGCKHEYPIHPQELEAAKHLMDLKKESEEDFKNACKEIKFFAMENEKVLESVLVCCKCGEESPGNMLQCWNCGNELAGNDAMNPNLNLGGG